MSSTVSFMVDTSFYLLIFYLFCWLWFSSISFSFYVIFVYLLFLGFHIYLLFYMFQIIKIIVIYCGIDDVVICGASQCLGACMLTSTWDNQSWFGFSSFAAPSVNISFAVDTYVVVNSVSSCFSVHIGWPHPPHREKHPHDVKGILIFFNASGIPNPCAQHRAPMLDQECVLEIFCFVISSVGWTSCFFPDLLVFIFSSASIISWPP